VSKHIDLLGLLYVVAGALSALVAVSLLSLGLGAFTVAWGPVGERTGMAATLTGAVFVVVAIVLLAWAALCAWAGRGLRRRRPWARLATLALSVLHLFILPFGTALGAYSLWVLVHHEARQQFEPPLPARAGQV
jgi:hypothetical protein